MIRHPFLEGPRPVAIAHRGGALEAPENTRAAFEYAVSIGYTHLETDMHVTRDGVAVLFHDERLDRTTDTAGRVSDLTWAQLRQVETAAGRDQILRLDEALELFPEQRFNVDIKSPEGVVPLCRILAATGAFDRVLVASFSDARLRAVRRHFGPRVATSAGPREIAAAVASLRIGRGFPVEPVALQIPMSTTLGPVRVPIATHGLITAAHHHGAHVHVWTISDENQMRALLDLGVDGIMTDRPKLLRSVLEARGDWAA